MITSCARDRGNGSQDVCRLTWIREWGCEYRFFIGRGSLNPMADEVQFDVDDSFNHVVDKEHMAFQWAIDQGYDYVYTSSPDCYRILPVMLATPFSEHDYYGSRVLHEFYAGGCGFWLSRRSLEVLANSPVCRDYPDKAIGIVLDKAGIKWNPHDPLSADRYWRLNRLPCVRAYHAQHRLEGDGYRQFPA